MPTVAEVNQALATNLSARRGRRITEAVFKAEKKRLRKELRKAEKEEQERRIAAILAQQKAEREALAAKRRAALVKAREAKAAKKELTRIGLETIYVGADIEGDLYDLWKRLRDRGAGNVRLVFGDRDIATVVGDYKTFRTLFIEQGESAGVFIPVEGEKIVVVKPTQLTAQKIFQHFRDGIQHCVFTPILRILKTKMESSESSGVKKRYQQRIGAMLAMQDKYIKGVPETAMEEVAKTAGFKIVMDTMGKALQVWNENGKVAVLHLRNTRENHVEEAGVLVTDKDFKVVTEEQMAQLWENREDYYMVEGDLKNGKPNKLHFLTEAFKVENPEQDILNDFSKQIGLANYGFCASKHPDVNAFIKEGRIVPGWSADINGGPSEKCVDMPKAYAQFKKCSYYSGFMGVIHQWRTGAFDAEFLRKHIGIYRFNIVKCENRLFRKLGIRAGASVVLPSVEILYFLDNGVEGSVTQGVWGARTDFEFSDEMLEKRRYCIWSGRCGMERTHKTYTFPGSEEWAAHLKATLVDANIIYWKSNSLITVKIPLKTVFTYHHILAFITSYTRIQMLQAMSQFKYEQLCRVVMDGIYYCGARPDTLDWFVEKESKDAKSIDGWYSSSSLQVDWKPVVYAGNTMVAGQGGAGKTYGILTDGCYNHILYVVPQHVLGQRVTKQYGVPYTTVHQMIGLDCRPYIEKYNYPPVIIWDEVTQYDAEWVEKGMKMYKDSLHLIVGDIDATGQWFQTRNGKPGAFSKVWKPVGVEFAYVEGDRRSRDEQLKELKLNVRAVMREVFNGGDAGEDKIMSVWAKRNLKGMTFESAVEMFKTGDTWIAGTHKTNQMLLERGVVSGYYKKGGWISSEEKEGYEKRGSFTIHSYQGTTIEDGLIFISIDDMFEYTMLYTAISRAVHFDQLVFVF